MSGEEEGEGGLASEKELGSNWTNDEKKTKAAEKTYKLGNYQVYTSGSKDYNKPPK